MHFVGGLCIFLAGSFDDIQFRAKAPFCAFVLDELLLRVSPSETEP